MKQLDREQEIVKLAADLQVNWQQNAVQNIISLCHDKISRWLKGGPKIQSIRQLEELLCTKLKLVFEEVTNDDDLKRIIKKYVHLGEPVFATLSADLDDKTFATLIERRRIDGNSHDRYVAIIDCRGEKFARRFFTRWHEIAHLLTLQGQLELPLHRSRRNASPTERLMDVLAGEIGFYSPLFGPILHQETVNAGGLTFKTVERIRESFCAEASFSATLNACVSRLGSPVLLVEIGLGFKKCEEKEMQSEQGNLFPVRKPQPKLRILKGVGNNAARATALQIHRNMQVPPASILSHFFFQEGAILGAEIDGIENLNIWHHSDGKSLANRLVHIHARRFPDSVIALLAPVAKRGR